MIHTIHVHLEVFMGDSIAAVPKAKASEYTALLEEYKNLQTTAYKSQSVTKPQLDALKTKLDTFIKDNVTDAAQKTKLTSAFDSEFEAMSDAVELKTSSGKNSNKSWDETRADMEGLMTDLAQTVKADAPTFGDPMQGSTPALTSRTAGATGSTAGADLGGVDAYVAQHPEAKPYLEMVKAASVKYQPGTPVIVLLRQIMAESTFRPDVTGKYGEQGLTQFTRETWGAYGEGDYNNSWDPQMAINAQAKYMSVLQTENGGNLAYALESYNGFDRNASWEHNMGKGCSPNYVQDITGQPYDQRKDAKG